MGWESFCVFRFNLGPLVQGQTRIAKLKSGYNTLTMGWESSGVIRLDLRPLLQGQMRIAKVKAAYNSLIIGSRDLGW